MSFTSKRFNRFMATGTTAALVATAIVPVVSAHESTLSAFTDVAPQYEEAIDYIVKNNIAKGLSGSQFGVKEEIIRGDVAIMIAQAAGLMNENAPASGFKDVPARGRLAINSLKAAGVINGKSATEFDFQSEITRGEAALMLAKAYKLTANKESLIFTDVVGTRYDDAVSALVGNEVTNGISATQFGTLKNIKRGDFARFLYRLAEEKADDTEAPVLSYGGDTNLTIKIGEELSWPAVIVKDNLDSKVQVDLTITDKTGKVIPQEEFNTSITGTYQLLYTAVDAAGNKSESIIVTLLITDMVPPVALTFLELNTPYVSSDNKMTVTMENLKVVDMGDFYEVQLTYKEQNNTTDQVIDQGAFKIFYENGESEPQYGFFNKLYPSEESTRSYTFKALKSQEILAIEYGADLFFKQQPTEETLKWVYEEVEDTEAPILSSDGDKNLSIEAGEAWNWPAVTANDKVDGEVEVDLVITDEAGNEHPEEAFTTSIPGTYQFLYTAVDSAGNEAGNLVVTLTITETAPPAPTPEVVFLELNTAYVSSDNKMTVTMENLEVVDMGDFYKVQLTYKEQNNTTDQAIDQGAFKIYYTNGESEPQYGFFNKLYPGEESTRSYTFDALKSQEILAIEYGADLFFKQQPTPETLKWNIVN